MHNQDWNRDRRRRETENENDWDWYYYEYRYMPYGYERENDREVNRGSAGNRDPYRERYGSRAGYGREQEQSYRSGPYSDDWTRGPFSGRGPRGYRRTDDRIREDVNDRLTWHGYIDATDIHVEVNDGIVTLSGEVNSRREKRMAEDAVENISGVDDVNNQLKVKNKSWDSGEGVLGRTNRQIRPGMEVVGRDGEQVGEVKEVRSNDFLVDRSMARDIYIPFNACEIRGGQIRLSVRADEVDNQGWETPELFDMSEENRAGRS